MARTRDGNSTLFSASMAGTLRLIGYLALACILMVVDYRNHWLMHARYGAAAIVQPAYRLAALPAEAFDVISDNLRSRHQLNAENRRLRESLLQANARLNRMRALGRENRKLKRLLDTRSTLGMDAQMARLIDVDLGAYRHRVVIDTGSSEGVTAGQAVIDSGGVMGQVVDVLPDMSTVMLITDPNSAVPVVNARTSERTVAYGSRDGSLLRLPNIPVSADMRSGDRLVTSGLGGRFAPGLPVGRIQSVHADAAGTFLRAAAQPAAHLRRSSHVLLLRDVAPPIGPPAPAASVGPPVSLAGPAAGDAS